MLHVTNGSVFLSRLHDLGLPGDIIPWDDILHEGPVPADLSDAALRRVRAEFLGEHWHDSDSIERSMTARDAHLAAAAGGDEIVLWYEHDLYDQLHVLQVLDQLGRLGAALTAHVTAVLANDYLTAQPDDTLRVWFVARQPLSEEHWQAAAAAWNAFRAPDPLALAAFEHPGAWPNLTAAIARHLQQFPALDTGLSRTERQTLGALADGPLPLRAAFHQSNHEVEDAIFMGDLGWWSHIRSLVAAPHPLIAVANPAPADFNDAEWWRDEDPPMLSLTETGAQVLAGEADRIALNGIDRWLGGVHLVREPAAEGRANAAVWRWDEGGKRIVRA